MKGGHWAAIRALPAPHAEAIRRLLPPPIQALTRQVPQSALYPTPESPQGVWIPAQAEPNATSAGVFPGARARHRRSPNASLAWARERLKALEKARQAVLKLQLTRIP